MKAVAYRAAVPNAASDSLIDITLPNPVASGHYLLVEVHAVSVNPIGASAADAAGVVRAAGGRVTLFKPGDRVMYAGSIPAPGTSSKLQLVDERLVGHAPTSVGFEAAAALPLASITAWVRALAAHHVIDQTRALPEQLRAIGIEQVADVATLTNYDCGVLFTRLGHLVDSGVLRSPLVEPFGTINAANLRRAHAFLASGESRGKVVLSGF